VERCGPHVDISPAMLRSSDDAYWLDLLSAPDAHSDTDAGGRAECSSDAEIAAETVCTDALDCRKKGYLALQQAALEYDTSHKDP